MDIHIDDESITINARFKVFHQKEVETSVNLELPNVFDIPQIQSEFTLES